VNPLALLLSAMPSVPGATTSPAPAIDPDRVTPGVLGLLGLVFLVVAVYFLWRSMNRQLRKVDFDESGATASPAEPASELPTDQQSS